MSMTRKKILDSVPRYRAVLQDEPEYFSVGHDMRGCGRSRLRHRGREASLCHHHLRGDGGSKSKKFHFTLVDVKPPVFARDLLVFHMLVAMRSQDDYKKKEETSWAIAYVFAGQVMPPWASGILHESISALITTLEDSSSNVMDIFYVSGPAREKIIHILKQWREPPVETYTVAAIRRMMVEQSDAQNKAFAKESEDEPPHPKFPPGCLHTDSDARLFNDIHVVLPSVPLLERHEPELLLVSRAYRESHSPSDRKALDDYINSTWKPNVTVLDFEFELKCEDRGTLSGQPFFNWSPDGVATALFIALPYQIFLSKPGVFEHISAFFRKASSSLEQLGDRIVIEVVTGEMNDTFERLRYGLLRFGQKAIGKPRPEQVPKQIRQDRHEQYPNFQHQASTNRVLLSDYVGGSFTSFIHGIPLLREEGRSLLRSYVLRNLHAWDSHDIFLAEYLVLGEREARPHLLEVQHEHPIGVAAHRATLIASCPSKIACHGEDSKCGSILTSSSSACPIFATEPRTWGVSAPLNLTSFLHLVAHVASLGYPRGWLSRILHELCTGMLTQTRAAPPIDEITDEGLAEVIFNPVDFSVGPFCRRVPHPRRHLGANPRRALGLEHSRRGQEAAPGSQDDSQVHHPIPKGTDRDYRLVGDILLLGSHEKKSLKAPGRTLRGFLDDRMDECPKLPNAKRVRREPHVHMISACKFTPETFEVEFCLTREWWTAWSLRLAGRRGSGALMCTNRPWALFLWTVMVTWSRAKLGPRRSKQLTRRSLNVGDE
ncbi:unnamed protein product [Clonostachys rosea f. rosea IK726]|uniref:Uncharacterized protein n=1 Tax=Clonostachys rosea f. rosea IK726 TaxID=1349383 RepID=A0ACA9UG96_BIOOC|nr:unnamed protein product [Clonostachys rosea f. rosea IK726]